MKLKQNATDWAGFQKRAKITHFFHLPQVSSTNDWARDYILTTHPHEEETVVIVAAEQTSGRGQGNHHWWSPRGMLALSLIVSWERLGFQRATSSDLSQYLAERVRATIIEILVETGVCSRPHWLQEVEIKEPNDILVGGKKIAGILVESPNTSSLVIGIGINLNNIAESAPPEIQNKLTSIKTLTGQEMDPASSALQLVSHILPS